jgi:hypothetical protein
MDHATKDIILQVVGLAAVFVPMLALFVGLAIASRRRQAAEQAEFDATSASAPDPSPERP